MRKHKAAGAVASYVNHFDSFIPKTAALLVCALLLCVLGAQAQNTADIVGTVTDQSGGAVPNAKVTVTNIGTNVSRSMQSGATGDFSFTLLPVGSYSVAVEANGFKKFQASNVTLAAGDRARVDAPMQVGEQTVTVHVSATQAPLLQTDSATVGGLVTSQATQDLPLNGRNVINLVQMAPGANQGTQSSLGGGNRPDDRRQTSTVSANGQNDSSNNFLLDGMDNNERSIATTIVKPSVDSLEEVKVDTSMYSANLGRVGGAVISMVTKSGSNNFHGDAFEFFRNDMFDAKSVFNNPQPGNPLAGKKGELRQNQFGGSLGGPIRKDKTFFFLDYEALRIIRGQLQTAFIPTACELTGAGCPVASTTGGLAAGLPGNFSDLCTAGFVAGVCSDPTQQVYMPTTSGQAGLLTTPFVNNIIPSAHQNPIAVNYAKLWPVLSSCTIALANAEGTAPACPFISSPNITQNFHTADARIDEHLSQNNTLFVRYTINSGNSYFPGAIPGVQFGNATVFGTAPAFAFGPNPTFPGSNYGRQQNITVGWDHIFRPELVLDLHAGVSRYVSLSTSANSGVDANTLFGGPANVNIPSIKGTDGLATMNFQQSPYSPLGDQFALPTDYWDTDYQYRAELTWIKRGHSIKFGGSLLRRNWARLQQLGKPAFNFNPLQTSGGGTGGNPLASSLTGMTNTRSEGVSLTQYNRGWEVGAYTQDDWRVNHWLTLNLGLRYDVFTYFTEKYNHLSNFDVTDPGVVAGGEIQVAQQNGVSPTVNLPTEHNLLQPRIGFAATLRHQFVLRGGLGTSYYVSNTAGPSQMDNAPFTYNYNDNKSLSTPFPFPAADPSTQCLVAACGATSPGLYNSSGLNGGGNISGKYQNALIIMANVTLEKAFGANVFSIGWVGEPGRHLPYQLPDANYPTPPGLVSPAKLNGTIAPGALPCGPLTTDGIVELPLQEPTPCSPNFAQLPYVGGIGLLESIGSSSYNALNAIFTRRFGKGLTVQANYTYAAALSNSPGTNACDQCGLLLNNLRYDWGFSDFDVRHRVAVQANYQLPVGKSMTGVMGEFAKGWQVNGIYSFESGLPFTIDDSTTQMGVGSPGTTDRPDMVKGSSNFHKSLSEWFDITQFVMQPYGFPGDAHRNQTFGPPTKRFDFSLFKDFKVHENLTLQFRAEFFNLTNTPNFGQPNNQLLAFSGQTQAVTKIDSLTGNPVSVPVIGGVCSSPPCVATNAGGFGSVQSANTLYNPREIQFALKLMF